MEQPRLGSAVRFGDFRFDLEVGELRDGDGELVPLRPKATAVLTRLVEAADKLVPQEKLLEAGWGDAYVEEDSALHKAIGDIRQALGDSATDPRFVATVHRRGYRFIAEVRLDPGRASLATRLRHGVTGPIGPKLIGLAAVLAVVTGAVVVSSSMLAGPDARADAESAVLSASDEVLKARYLLDAGTADAISRGASMLREAVAGDDRSPFAWSGLAVAELRLGNFDRAREAALQALELRPLDADARRILGQCALVEGDFERAESELLRTLEIAPSSARAHHAYAYFLMRVGRMTEAIARAERAASLAPANAVIHANLARYLLYAGRFEEALARASKLEEFDDPLPAIRLSFLETLQASAWELGRYEIARDALVEYAVRSGAPEPVIASFQALPAREGGDAALRWRVRHLLERDPVPPSYRVQAALSLAQLGETDRCREQLAEVVRSDPAPAALQIALLDPRLARLGDGVLASGSDVPQGP